MAEYKSKNDLPKKQVHIYIYKDIDRILKAFNINTSEFVTMKTLELLGSNDIESEFKDVNDEIEKLENKKKDLKLQLDECDEKISKLKIQQDNLKRLISEYVPEEDVNYQKALEEIYNLVGNRLKSDKREPFIYFNDVIPICEKYGVNYQFVLSHIPADVQKDHFKLRFKKLK